MSTVTCQFFIDAVKIHQYLPIYHRDGFIAHIQRSRIFLCYCIPKLFQIGFRIKWFTLNFGYMYDISLLKQVLIFLQVWCLENLKVKGTLDMIAMIHWGNIHLVKSRHYVILFLFVQTRFKLLYQSNKQFYIYMYVMKNLFEC